MKYRSWEFLQCQSFKARCLFHCLFLKRKKKHKFPSLYSPFLTITAAIPKSDRKSLMWCVCHTVTGVNSLDVLHVMLSCREALVDSSCRERSRSHFPRRFSCVFCGKTVVQSYSRRLSLTAECKGELWLNNSSQSSTFTHSHTHSAVGKLLKLSPPLERGPVLLIDASVHLWWVLSIGHATPGAQPLSPCGVQTSPREIQNLTITRKWPNRLFWDSQHRKCVRHWTHVPDFFFEKEKRGTIY